MYIPKMALAVLLFPNILLGLRLVFHTGGTTGAVIAAVAVLVMVFVPGNDGMKKNRRKA